MITGSTRTYEYDGLGRRIQQTTGSTVHHYYFDTAGRVVENWIGTSLSQQFIWAGAGYVHELVLRDRPTERRYVSQDANYNVTGIFGPSGGVQERYTYAPYGVQTIYNSTYSVRSSSSWGWDIGFQGLRLDSVTGKYHTWERDYGAVEGRWMTLDPLLVGDSGRRQSLDLFELDAVDLNAFRFVRNNVINLTDPSGEFPAIFPLRLSIVAPLNAQLQPTQKGAYGIYVWPADFKLTLKPPCDGVIAQHVKVKVKAGPLGWSEDFWEFWDVTKNKPNVSPTVAFPKLLNFKNRGLPAKAMQGNHNDWYYFVLGASVAGSLDWVGEAWYVKGRPPGPLSGQHKVKFPGGGSQLVIPGGDAGAVPIPNGGTLHGFNDIVLRAWIGKNLLTFPVPHVYLRELGPIWKHDHCGPSAVG